MKPDLNYVQIKKPIFFVDDDPDDREIIKDSFCRLQCPQARFFQNGTALLTYLDTLNQADMPALVVLDSQLPGHDGKTLLEQLQKDARFCYVPIMILSSYVNKQKKAAWLTSGAWRVEEKPSSIRAYDQLMRDLILFASYC